MSTSFIYLIYFLNLVEFCLALCIGDNVRYIYKADIAGFTGFSLFFHAFLKIFGNVFALSVSQGLIEYFILYLEPDSIKTYLILWSFSAEYSLYLYAMTFHAYKAASFEYGKDNFTHAIMALFGTVIILPFVEILFDSFRLLIEDPTYNLENKKKEFKEIFEKISVHAILLLIIFYLYYLFY
jgi:Na+-driven multidrug efflux pump